MRNWTRSLLLFLLVALAAAASVQPGAAASMSVEMGMSSTVATDMAGCDDCDDIAGMSDPSCMTACATACPAILVQAGEADTSLRVAHDLLRVPYSVGIARTPDPFPPRHSALTV
ncbi:MAG: hypothetical protein ACK4R3_10945 [Aliihoeflea sp.]|jgi:hypothetical protein